MTADASPPVRRRGADVVGLSLLGCALLAVALVLVNVAIARTSVRVDLTEEKLYTLSPSTKKVLASLSDPAEIRVYWSDAIPASANPVRRRVEGLLREYAAQSDDRLTVTWVDMSEEGEGAKEAEALKDRRHQPMPEFQFRVFEGGRLQFSKGYMGLSIRYLDQMEFVGPLAAPDPDQEGFRVPPSLEYDLTSQIARMARGKPPGIGLVKDASGGGFSFANAHGGNDRFTVLSEALEQQYGDAAKTWLSLDDKVPDDVQVLVVAAPKDWPEKKVFHLEQFLLRGGKVILFLDPVNFEVVRGAPPTKSGLESWLSSHGVAVADGVLADWASHAQTVVDIGGGRATFMDYPYFPVVRKDSVGDHPITAPPETSRIDFVPTYFPVEVKVDAEKQQAAGRKATVLLTTSDEGYLKPDTGGLMQIPDAPPNPSSKGRHSIAVVLEGTFTSFWKGKPSPLDEKKDEKPEGTEGAKDDDLPTPGESTKPPEPPVGAVPPVEPPPPAPSPPPAMADEPPAAPAPSAPPETPMDGGARGPEGPEGEDAEPPAPPAMSEPPPASPPVPAPAEPPKPADEPKKEEPKKDEPPKPKPLEEGKGALVVVGDADFVSDAYSGTNRDRTSGVTQIILRGATGFPFAFNAIDWALGNDDLAALRGRGANPRTIPEVTGADATGIKLANYLVAPLLIVLVGILVWVVRRYRT